MINKLSKKYQIKIPKNLKIIYVEKKNLIIFEGPLKTKAFQIDFKLYITNEYNTIYVTKILNNKNFTTKKNNLTSIRRTTVSAIKKLILEVSVVLTKKLKLIGVGYKVFPLTVLEKEFLQFKIGFSHFIYYKVPTNVKIISHKSVSLYIFGHSYYLINQIAANLQKYKAPEPYKGKGILYENERIVLKQGKKI